MTSAPTGARPALAHCHPGTGDTAHLDRTDDEHGRNTGAGGGLPRHADAGDHAAGPDGAAGARGVGDAASPTAPRPRGDDGPQGAARRRCGRGADVLSQRESSSPGPHTAPGPGATSTPRRPFGPCSRRVRAAAPTAQHAFLRGPGAGRDPTCARARRLSRHERPRGYRGSSYISSSRAAYFSSTSRRLIFMLGVISPSSTERSRPRIRNRLMVSQRFNRSLRTSTDCWT